MDKEKMLKRLLDNLRNKSDHEIIKSYEDSGIKVVSYKPGTIGQVCLYDYSNGIVSGDICSFDFDEIEGMSKFTKFTLGEDDVA